MNLTDDAVLVTTGDDSPVGYNNDEIMHRLSRLMIYLIKRQL